jgi:RsiW-degrading membrane proteinase PrsW (M82 family)
MKIYIKRKRGEFGPYSADTVQAYLEAGTIDPHDLARLPGEQSYELLSELLSRTGIPQPLPADTKNPAFKALADLGSLNFKLILPFTAIRRLNWLRDPKFISMAIIGLMPAAVVFLAPNIDTTYWAIAAYFTLLWALFFYYLFRTPEVNSWACPACLLATMGLSFLYLMLAKPLHGQPWLQEYITSDNNWKRFLGMFLFVGIPEEICKAIVVFALVGWHRRLMPQTAVFYGMLSGLGFGVYEGVKYQQEVNRALGVDTAWFLNIFRMTTLPFFHGILTGIAAYYIGFAKVFRHKRLSLWLLAIIVPALIHGLYNTLGPGLPGLGILFLGVLILMIYLSQSGEWRYTLIRSRHKRTQ